MSPGPGTPLQMPLATLAAPATPRTLRPVDVPAGVQLVYADDALLVFDKPAGLLSVPGRGADNADCLSARAQALYPDALVVHRLDMGTSGLLVLARGLAAQRTLSHAFASRQVHKRYEAVVAGQLGPCQADAEGWSDIHLPLIVDWPNRPKSKVDFDIGKPSHTRWRVLGPGPFDLPDGRPTTRLALEPITGRSHQLRLHLQAIGNPILGDELYADDLALDAAPRLLLHACSIDLPHPVSTQRLTLQTPPPF